MTIYCAEADLVGKGAYTMYKNAGLSVTVTGSEPPCGLVCCGGWSCTVRRVGARSWEVWDGSETFSFGSQWELLAWIGDRL